MMRYLSLNEYRSRFTELKKQDLYKMSISESSRFISNEMMENVDSWNRYWIIKKEDFVNQIDAQIFPSRSERMLIELDGIMFYVLKIHNERVKYYPENDRHKHETYSFIQDKFNQAYLGFQIESPYDRYARNHKVLNTISEKITKHRERLIEFAKDYLKPFVQKSLDTIFQPIEHLVKDVLARFNPEEKYQLDEKKKYLARDRVSAGLLHHTDDPLNTTLTLDFSQLFVLDFFYILNVSYVNAMVDIIEDIGSSDACCYFVMIPGYFEHFLNCLISPVAFSIALYYFTADVMENENETDNGSDKNLNKKKDRTKVTYISMTGYYSEQEVLMLLNASTKSNLIYIYDVNTGPDLTRSCEIKDFVQDETICASIANGRLILIPFELFSEGCKVLYPQDIYQIFESFVFRVLEHLDHDCIIFNHSFTFNETSTNPLVLNQYYYGLIIKKLCVYCSSKLIVTPSIYRKKTEEEMSCIIDYISNNKLNIPNSYLSSLLYVQNYYSDPISHAALKSSMMTCYEACSGIKKYNAKAILRDQKGVQNSYFFKLLGVWSKIYMNTSFSNSTLLRVSGKLYFGEPKYKLCADPTLTAIENQLDPLFSEKSIMKSLNWVYQFNFRKLIPYFKGNEILTLDLLTLCQKDELYLMDDRSQYYIDYEREIPSTSGTPVKSIQIIIFNVCYIRNETLQLRNLILNEEDKFKINFIRNLNMLEGSEFHPNFNYYLTEFGITKFKEKENEYIILVYGLKCFLSASNNTKIESCDIYIYHMREQKWSKLPIKSKKITKTFRTNPNVSFIKTSSTYYLAVYGGNKLSSLSAGDGAGRQEIANLFEIYKGNSLEKEFTYIPIENKESFGGDSHHNLIALSKGYMYYANKSLYMFGGAISEDSILSNLFCFYEINVDDIPEKWKIKEHKVLGNQIALPDDQDKLSWHEAYPIASKDKNYFINENFEFHVLTRHQTKYRQTNFTFYGLSLSEWTVKTDYIDSKIQNEIFYAAKSDLDSFKEKVTTISSLSDVILFHNDSKKRSQIIEKRKKIEINDTIYKEFKLEKSSITKDFTRERDVMMGIDTLRSMASTCCSTIDIQSYTRASVDLNQTVSSITGNSRSYTSAYNQVYKVSKITKVKKFLEDLKTDFNWTHKNGFQNILSKYTSSLKHHELSQTRYSTADTLYIPVAKSTNKSNRPKVSSARQVIESAYQSESGKNYLSDISQKRTSEVGDSYFFLDNDGIFYLYHESYAIPLQFEVEIKPGTKLNFEMRHSRNSITIHNYYLFMYIDESFNDKYAGVLKFIIGKVLVFDLLEKIDDMINNPTKLIYLNLLKALDLDPLANLRERTFVVRDESFLFLGGKLFTEEDEAFVSYIRKVHKVNFLGDSKDLIMNMSELDETGSDYVFTQDREFVYTCKKHDPKSILIINETGNIIKKYKKLKLSERKDCIVHLFLWKEAPKKLFIFSGVKGGQIHIHSINVSNFNKMEEKQIHFETKIDGKDGEKLIFNGSEHFLLDDSQNDSKEFFLVFRKRFGTDEKLVKCKEINSNDGE